MPVGHREPVPSRHDLQLLRVPYLNMQAIVIYTLASLICSSKQMDRGLSSMHGQTEGPFSSAFCPCRDGGHTAAGDEMHFFHVIPLPRPRVGGAFVGVGVGGIDELVFSDPDPAEDAKHVRLGGKIGGPQR